MAEMMRPPSEREEDRVNEAGPESLHTTPCPIPKDTTEIEIPGDGRPGLHVDVYDWVQPGFDGMPLGVCAGKEFLAGYQEGSETPVCGMNCFVCLRGLDPNEIPPTPLLPQPTE